MRLLLRVKFKTATMLSGRDDGCIRRMRYVACCWGALSDIMPGNGRLWPRTADKNPRARGLLHEQGQTGMQALT